MPTTRHLWLSTGYPQAARDAIVCITTEWPRRARSPAAAGLTDRSNCTVWCHSEGRKAIRDGSMNASIWVDSHAEFVAAFNIIDAYYAGKPFERETMIAPTLVTKDNIDQLFPDDAK